MKIAAAVWFSFWAGCTLHAAVGDDKVGTGWILVFFLFVSMLLAYMAGVAGVTGDKTVYTPE